jgi:hypothetical protein
MADPPRGWDVASAMIRRSSLLGAATVLLALGFSAGPAAAAGNAALAQHIIADPIPGGVSASQADTQDYVNYIDGIETAATASLGVSVQVAARAWFEGGNKTVFVIVTLVALHQTGRSTKATNQQAATAAKAASNSFCPGVTGSVAFLNKPVVNIPNSHYAMCDNVKGDVAETITTARANVFAFIESNLHSVTPSQFEAMALRQYNALPTTRSPNSSTSSVNLIAGIVAGAMLFIVLLVLLLVLRARRIRRKNGLILAFSVVAGADGPAPGWYADPLNAQQQRYWNGVTWGPRSRDAAAPPAEGDPATDARIEEPESSA